MNDYKIYYEEGKLLKFNNGYILQFDRKPKKYVYSRDTSVLSVFFNEFKDNYILQEVRGFLSIRRDKGRDGLQPYVVEIKNKSFSRENLFPYCLETLMGLLEKDPRNKESFCKNANLINKKVQEYFSDDLYTYIPNPIFNENINI